MITDFTSGAISAGGGIGQWGFASRTLGVALSNRPSDCLQHFGFPAIDMAGGTAIRLTESWFPDGDSGCFLLDLLNNGTLATRATFTYDQFASGPPTIEAAVTSLQGSLVDQWQLVGNGSSASAFGDLQLTAMSVVTAPEPATPCMVLVGLACGHAQPLSWTPADTCVATPCGSSWKICTTVPLVKACTIAPVAGSTTTAASRTFRPVSR